MRTVLHKSKQYWLAALKVLVLTFTFGYIYHKISSAETLQWNTFISEINQNNLGYWIWFLVLAAVNWVFEILKWQTAVSKVESISFLEATKQSLTALTVSLPTPNRIGDYGAKAFFFTSEKRKEVVLLNFINNSTQMLITCLFGAIGLFLFLQKNSLPLSYNNLVFVSFSIIIVALVGYYFRKKQILFKGLSISKVISYLKKLSKSIKLKLVLFSTIRYAIFSFLFFQLLMFFGAEISAANAIPIIFMMYFLVSIFPTFLLFDVVVRGGVAVWLFSYTNVPELAVLCTVFSMWLLNFILPALAGSIYVITYKHKAA